MAFDITTFDAMLKPIYDKAAEVVIKDFPLYALIKRTTDFGGKNLTHPIYYGNNAGRNRTFANSQTYSSATKMVDLVLTRKYDYCPAFVSRELFDASMGDVNSALRASTHALNDAMLALTKNLEASLFRDSSGIIARLDGSSPTTTLTLRNPSDIVNFEIGMPLKLSADSAASSLRSGVMVVTAIDEDLGVITAAGNVTGSANDYLLVDGDATLSINGLSAYCPEVVPSTAFLGIPNRQVETGRLAGYRFTPAAGASIKSTIRGLANRMVRGGGHPKVCLINTDGFDKLADDLGNSLAPNSVQVKSSGKGEWGFEAIRIVCAEGAVDVVAAPQCPAGVLFCIDTDQIEFKSLGPAPKLQEMGVIGKYFQPVYNADQLEARACYYGELLVKDARAIGRANYVL